MKEEILYERRQMYFCRYILIFCYLGNSCLNFCTQSKIVGYKIVELSDGYWNFHESYDIRGRYFSSSTKLFIPAK